MAQYPAIIDLSHLDGSDGFKLMGSPGRRAGWSVAGGDINGDGFADLLVGAPQGNGECDVVFGRASGFAAVVNLSSRDASIAGGSFGDYCGRSVSAGDINGDGFADVIVAAPGDYGHAGSAGVYVVFGGPARFNLHPGDLDGTNGFRIDGAPATVSVSWAGDVNGDGFGDLVVGSVAGDHQAGVSYIVFGKASGFAATVDLPHLDGTDGFSLNGVRAKDESGFSVASAGDVNGDGFADVVVGAPYADPNGSVSGTSYVVFGKASQFAANIDLASLDGTNGFRVDGLARHDFTGLSVATAGDVNGDGLSDLVIGAPGASPGGREAAGVSYVVFGKAGAFPEALDLAGLDGTNGFRISGAGAHGYSGSSVAAAGDVNGDGFDDVIIGANSVDAGPNCNAGAAYVVFGKEGGFAGNIDVKALDGSNGFKLRQLDGANSFTGTSVSGAGDVNGDGFADLIVGAPSIGSEGVGSAYLIFGRAPDTAVERIGTVASQTLAGGAFGDTLSGMAGDDRLYGNAGNDTLDGGEGNDWISGGIGVDVLIGFEGNDILSGGLGGDSLRTGLGRDTVTCASVKESTGASFDTIIGFDAKHDVFDLGVTVAGLDPTISTGRLSNGDFQKDVAAAVNATTLLAQHAVMFVPDRGVHAGERFLVVDANGTAGYQANADFVFRLDQPHNLGRLSGDSFV